MENNAELVRLEEFVDKLLAKYNQLKTDYHALQDTLRERDAECAELKNNIFNLSTERTEVGNRVSGLLGRIEQWENEHIATTTMEKDNDNTSVQGSLFSDDAENRNS
jgi:predicted nuclease with TOPRIM domain